MAHRPATSSWLNGIMGRGRSAETGGCRRSASLTAPPSTCTAQNAGDAGDRVIPNCPGRLDASLRRSAPTLFWLKICSDVQHSADRTCTSHTARMSAPASSSASTWCPALLGWVLRAGKVVGGQVRGWESTAGSRCLICWGGRCRQVVQRPAANRLACHQQASQWRIIVATGCWLQTQLHASQQQYRLRNACSQHRQPHPSHHKGSTHASA